MPEPDTPLIRVWCRLTGSLDDHAIAVDAAVLSPEERARSSRFVFAEDRRDYVAAHALVRRALSSMGAAEPSSWRFTTGPHGKPAVASAGPRASAMEFNLSHARGCVACAVSSGPPVGIDVESISRSRDRESLAARYFHPSETAALRSLPDETSRVRFTELWTLKEAYLKATGRGLSVPLRDCAFEFGERSAIRLVSAAGSDPSAWRFALYGIDAGYRLAIAWLTAGSPSELVDIVEGVGIRACFT